MVLYYHLPEAMDSTELTLEISDKSGKIIRSISSKKDKDYQPHNGGGPPPAPVLSTKKGLNRFVWDLKHPILPGIPGTYIEADFTGHKVKPGTYNLKLKMGDEVFTAIGEVVSPPNLSNWQDEFQEYDAFMSELEANVTDMHNKVNKLFKVQKDLAQILTEVKDKSLKTEGEALVKKLIAWDEEMIQRKSQAYDDVENFPNKFTAEYLFLLNQSNSAIPKINQPSKDRKAELDAQWTNLKRQAESLISTDIPDFNKKLWNSGVGAIRI